MTKIRHVTPTPTEIVGTEALRLALNEATGRNYSRSTVDRLVRGGLIRHYRRMPGKNGAYLFRKAEVTRFARTIEVAA